MKTECFLHRSQAIANLNYAIKLDLKSFLLVLVKFNLFSMNNLLSIAYN